MKMKFRYLFFLPIKRVIFLIILYVLTRITIMIHFEPKNIFTVWVYNTNAFNKGFNKTTMNSGLILDDVSKSKTAVAFSERSSLENKPGHGIFMKRTYQFFIPVAYFYIVWLYKDSWIHQWITTLLLTCIETCIEIVNKAM